MDIYNLLLKVKKDLADYNNNSDISPKDLLIIRKCLLNSDSGLKVIYGLSNCHDFDSLLNSYDDEMNFNRKQFIDDEFNPWLNFFLEKNYEINIRMIDPSEQIIFLDDDLPGKIEELKKAFQDRQFESVTTKSNSILQQIFKDICDKKGIVYTSSDNSNDLYSKLKSQIKLDIKAYEGTDNDFCKKFSRNICSLVITLNDLRNLYSEAHGTSKESRIQAKILPIHHFKLIVDMTVTLANFYVETYYYQSSKEIDF